MSIVCVTFQQSVSVMVVCMKEAPIVYYDHVSKFMEEFSYRPSGSLSWDHDVKLERARCWKSLATFRTFSLATKTLLSCMLQQTDVPTDNFLVGSWLPLVCRKLGVAPPARPEPPSSSSSKLLLERDISTQDADANMPVNSKRYRQTQLKFERMKKNH